MRRVFYLILLSLSLLNAENFIDLYRHKGIESVKNRFDALLKDPKYWSDYLKDYDVSLGYYESGKNVILCDKKDKILEVYDISSGKIERSFKSSVLVGKNGEKKKEGDLITPVGVYTIVSTFVPQDTFYGPVAFALSYPNLFDKLAGRNGHGIWIHGYPLKNDKRPDITKGCLVMKNDKIKNLKEILKPKKTYVIIAENRLKKANKEEIAKILSFLYRWKDSWAKSDINRYLSFYSKEFKRFDGKDFESFAKMKK
ncbi:MAG: L,D-transpeptidase family protein, partial [Epsilonproteobacteria bacterium]|nr:L,D-transpeptidase family protein [Campylobacterota bacterium]